MRHSIKCWPQYFQRVKDGTKTFEVRVNDRGYQSGDIVLLREWDKESVSYAQHPMDHDCDGYTGRELEFSIGYILPIDAERVVFSLLPLTGVPK